MLSELHYRDLLNDDRDADCLTTLNVRYYAIFLRTNFIRKLLHYAAFQTLLSEAHQVRIIWL